MHTQGAPMLLLLPLLFVTVSYGGEPHAEDHGGHESPSFCRKYDCPKYEMVKQYNNTFEERKYESSRWVSTQLDKASFTQATMEGFWRLYHYIDGKNSAGVKIPMTVPVLTRVVRSEDGFASAITMSFFVPFGVEDPPQPLNPKLYLDTLPEQTVYVKSFDGFAFKSDYVEKAKSLSEDLKALGKSFNEASLMIAGYDAPFMLFNRHNEVCFIAE